ncbi:hypothetical protein [Oceaniglobus trochenteri]|uniref:hypothetical protein n=1 Tax=Oceaniglobus trochenteri TaxID=2763260 RepID=UPI001CFFD591|nr:hypothetical protein [Oceaniglobus trochenteri]
MKNGVFLPLLVVVVCVAALTGTIRGTLIGGLVVSGAMITAHVCARRAGRWRVPVFAVIFTALPVALALALADAMGLSVTTGGAPSFAGGRVTGAGLRELLVVFGGFALLALAVDAIAARYLPR